MKIQKISLFCLMLTVSFSLFGQTQKGNIQLGGSFSGGFSLYESGFNFNILTSASSAQFITKGLAVKESLGYSYYYTDANAAVNRYTSSSLGVGLLYYFPTGKLQPMVGSEINYSVTGNSTIGINGDFTLSLNIGASYFISDHVAIELFYPIFPGSYLYSNAASRILRRGLYLGFQTYLH